MNPQQKVLSSLPCVEQQTERVRGKTSEPRLSLQVRSKTQTQQQCQQNSGRQLACDGKELVRLAPHNLLERRWLQPEAREPVEALVSRQRSGKEQGLRTSVVGFGGSDLDTGSEHKGPRGTDQVQEPKDIGAGGHFTTTLLFMRQLGPRRERCLPKVPLSELQYYYFFSLTLGIHDPKQSRTPDGKLSS